MLESLLRLQAWEDSCGERDAHGLFTACSSHFSLSVSDFCSVLNTPTPSRDVSVSRIVIWPFRGTYEALRDSSTTKKKKPTIAQCNDPRAKEMSQLAKHLQV